VYSSSLLRSSVWRVGFAHAAREGARRRVDEVAARA
jgi:hypothetical protein